jgi:hypothetical protein
MRRLKLVKLYMDCRVKPGNDGCGNDSTAYRDVAELL